MELKEIQEYVKKQLSEKRYNHSVGVMERSEELAKMCSIIMQKRSEIIRLINESRDGFDLIYLPSLTLSQFEDMADIQSLKEIHLK